MTTERSFKWSRLAVLGLLASTAALAVVGVCAAFLHLPDDYDAALKFICVIAFSCVAGFALAVAQAATSLLAILKARPERLAAFWIAVICATLCGLVSLAGAHLGYAVLVGAGPGIDPHLVDAAGLGLAFVKPAMSYAIAEAQEADRADRLAADRNEEDRAAADRAADRANRHAETMARIEREPAPISSQAPALSGGEPRPVRRTGSARNGLSVVEKTAAAGAAAMVLLAPSGQAHAVPISAPDGPAATTTEQVQPRGIITSEARARGRSLIAQGKGPAEVHRLTGVPLGTLKRQAAEFKRGRWAA